MRQRSCLELNLSDLQVQEAYYALCLKEWEFARTYCRLNAQECLNLSDRYFQAAEKLDTLRSLCSRQAAVCEDAKKVVARKKMELKAAKKESAQAFVNVCTEDMSLEPSEQALILKRLLINDQKAITPKIVEMIGREYQLGGRFSLHFQHGLKGFAMTVERGQNRVVIIQLPVIHQLNGTCKEHACLNRQVLTHYGGLGEVLDQEFVPRLIDQLNSDQTKSDIVKLIDRVRDLRRAAGHETLQGQGMSQQEFEKLQNLEDYDKRIAQGALVYYPHSGRFFDRKNTFKAQMKIRRLGYFGVFTVTVRNQREPDPIESCGIHVSSGPGHAIACRVERLLDGSLGVLVADSINVSQDGRPCPHASLIEGCGFVPQRFFLDFAQLFSFENPLQIHPKVPSKQ